MTANFQIHTNDMAQRENNKEHNTQNGETKHEKNTQETNNAKTHRSYTIATKSPMILHTTLSWHALFIIKYVF